MQSVGTGVLTTKHLVIFATGHRNGQASVLLQQGGEINVFRENPYDFVPNGMA